MMSVNTEVTLSGCVKDNFEVKGKACERASLNCVAVDVLCMHSCQVLFPAHTRANTDVKTTLMHSGCSSIVFQLIHEGIKLD